MGLLRARLVAYRPMHKIQIEILQVKILQGLLEPSFDESRILMTNTAISSISPPLNHSHDLLIIPQLRSNPYILSGEIGLLQPIGDTLAHGFLIPVCGGTVDLPIAGLDCQ